MKKLLYIIILCALNFIVKAQSTYPITQNLGSATTLVKVPTNGGLQAVLVATPFTDTTAANAVPYVKYTAGAMIRTTGNGKFWKRNEAKTAWVEVGSGSGGSTINYFAFYTDSSVIICYTDGHCDTVTFNNNNVFVTVNNAYGGCNNLLSGGIVTANNPTVNLVFDVTAADYTIGCRAYHTDATQVTLADGDATFNRFDVIIVDTNEVVSVVQGTPAADPQVPQINPASQLALTTILVTAGSTTASQLGITQTVIYDQNLGTPTEWNGAATAWTSDRDNLVNPAHLTKCDLVSGSTGSTSQISWATTDTMRNGQFDVFKFYIRLTDAWDAGTGFDISWYNGSTKVSNSVIMMNNSYGFESSTTGAYQVIAIPMANWVFTDSIFFSVIIKPLATPFASKAFRLDWIQLQGGINQLLGGSSGLYIWNQYSLNQPANYWIKGAGKVEGGFISTDVNYLGSTRIGNNTISAGVYSTALGDYANATAEGAVIVGSQSSGKGIVIGYGKSSSDASNASVGGTVTGTGNSLLGINGTITGNDNVKIGESGTVTGSRNVNIGYNVSHSFSNTISLGYQGVPTASNQFIISSNATRFTFPGVSRGVAGYVMTDSLGDGQYWVARPGGSVTAANNGTSLSSTTVQLGQDVSAVGNPAILLSNREIPMGGFTLSLNASATQSAKIFQTKNINGQIRASINGDSASFTNTGGWQQSEIFGNLAYVRGINAVAVGNQAGAANESVVVGRFANDTLSVGSNVLIGKSSLITSSLGGNTIVGNNASSTGSSGSNTVVGAQASTNSSQVVNVGYGSIVNSQSGTGLGSQINVASGHNYSIAIGSFSKTSAANQVVIGGSLNGGSIGAYHYFLGGGVVKESGSTIEDIDIQPTGSLGTDQAGVNFYINGAKRTGNSTTGGVLIFQTSTAGASGTTLQTLAPRIQINNSGIVAYGGVMPTSGSGGTDSAIYRNSSTGQFYLAPGGAGGGFTTADNGLTANTATNVQLGATSTSGGEFSVDRWINTSTNRLTVKGDKDRLFWVESASGRTAYFVGNDGNYVLNLINASTGGGLLISADGGGMASSMTTLAASTNTVLPIIQFNRETSGTGAAGLGASIQFALESSTSSGQVSNELISKWTDATHATRTSQFDITGVNSATTETFANFQTGGIVIVNNLADTLATKAYARSVGGVGGAAVWSAITDPTGNQALSFGTNTNTWTIGTTTATFQTNTANSLTTGIVELIQSSSITTGNLLKLSSTSTAANNFSLSNIVSSGANANATRTATGQSISVTNTGTTSTNVGLNVIASGATNNYAILAQGFVGISTPSVGAFTPTVSLEIKDANTGVTSFQITGTDGQYRLKIREYGGTIESYNSTMQLYNSYSAGVLNLGGGNVGNQIVMNGTRILYNTRTIPKQGADVASANNLSLGTGGDSFEITGTTQINLIDNTGYQNGAVIRLLFTSTPTVKNGQTTSGTNTTILLAGAADFSATANDVLILMLGEIGGTQSWFEIGRSVN